MKRPRKTRAGTGGDPIQVVGARENNLKGFDLALPRRSIVAVVGVSGSGKSSLLFRTLAAESAFRHDALISRGQRRARPRRPRCDRIEGLPFCLTVAQRALHRNPRSTVATFTGLHAALRRLVIDHGEIRCTCGVVVRPTDNDALLAYLHDVHNGRRVSVAAVVAREPLPGLHRLERTLLDEGHVRVELQSLPWGPRQPRALRGLGELDPNTIHAVAIPISVHRVSAGERAALRVSVERAFGLGRGGVLVTVEARARDAAQELDTHVQAVCSSCHRVHRRPDDPLLSFNSVPERSGRCPRCEGLGILNEVDEAAVVPDPSLSLDGECLALRRERGSYKYVGIRSDVIRGVCVALGDSPGHAFRRLSRAGRNAILFGMGDTRVLPIDAAGKKSGAKVRYGGIIPALRKLAAEPGVAGDYARSFVLRRACDACGGTRFRNTDLAAYVYGERPFTEILGDTVADSNAFLARCTARASGPERAWLDGASRVLTSLEQAGLPYLGIGRSSSTLSGGELQRLKIAACLHAGIVHAGYVLDEPSLGLHASDNLGLIKVIRALRDQGNTIIVADHDPDFVRAADVVVAVGPGPGPLGGELLSTSRRHSANEPVPQRGRVTLNPARAMRVGGATVNNLTALDVGVPLGGLVCLTGVSGSGKSSFAHHVLAPALEAFLASGRTSGPTWHSFAGASEVRQMARIGQQPIGSSMTSVIATYLGIYDAIRTAFAEAEVARARAYSASAFSFNRAEGRCPGCGGRGAVSDDDMSADQIECTQCGGDRFIDGVLDVRVRGHSIADVLRMEASRALALFPDDHEVTRRLRLLVELGIGHLQIGRPTPSLSGGEAQRLKIAASLAARGECPEGLFYIFDEPTAGLHRSDVMGVLACFDRLIAGGANTVMLIEHDLDVVAQADWIIDFGPGAGRDGGRVMYAGPPEGARAVQASRTGVALRERSVPAERLRQTSSPAPMDVGLGEADEEPTGTSERATRFLHALRRLDAGAVDDDHAAAAVSPTYVIATEGTSFANDAILLDALGLTPRLHGALLPLVRFSPPPEVEWIEAARDGLRVARRLEGPLTVAFSPITDLLESGEATRSRAVLALQACASRGFDHFVANGAVRPLAGLLRRHLAAIDLFSLRVVVGVMPRGDAAATALIEHALTAGQGWCSLIRPQQRGRLSDTQLASRPVSPDERRVGRRRMVAGLLDRRASGACPLCTGSGHVIAYREDLIVKRWRSGVLTAGFVTTQVEQLLRPIRGRMVKTLTLLGEEGVIDVISPAPPSSRERTTLLHGYPWARFPISGRSGQKDVDFFSWEGLVPIVRSRLHLATDVQWRSRVEASRAEASCPECDGTGFVWQARRSSVFGHPLPDLLTRMPLMDVAALLERGLHGRADRLLREGLADLCAAGFAAHACTAAPRELEHRLRQQLRAVGLKYLRLAEATHQIRFTDRNPYTQVSSLLATAAKDCRIDVTVPSEA